MSTEHKKDLDSVLVMEKVKELSDAISGSDDYAHYQKYLGRLKENKENYKKFNEFRAKHIGLQMNKNENYYADTVKLQDEYRNILADKTVIRFLIAEERINKMLREVHDYLAEHVEIDIGYLDN